MSVNLEKGSKHMPIDLKKEDSHKKINLTKDVKPSGAAVGGAGAPSNQETAKKSGSKKWIGIVAAAVLILLAAAAVNVIQSGRNSAVTDPASPGTNSGGNTSSITSTSTVSPSGDGLPGTSNGETAAGTSNSTNPVTGDASAAMEDASAAMGDTPAPTGDTPAPTGDTPAPTGDTPAPTGDTSASTGSESIDPVSNVVNDTGAGTAAAIIWSKKVDKYEIIVSNRSWSEAFNDCIARGGKLCTIDSAEENEAVISALREAGFYGTVYLGGMRDANSVDYHWVDKNKNMLDEVINDGDYKNFWLEGEPSYSDVAAPEESYMTILYRKESGWVWNDVCENIVSLSPVYYAGKVAYICEYD